MKLTKSKLKHIEVIEDPKYVYGKTFLSYERLGALVGDKIRTMTGEDLAYVVKNKLEDSLLYPEVLSPDEDHDRLKHFGLSSEELDRNFSGVYLIFEPGYDESPDEFVGSLKVDDGRLGNFLSGQSVEMSESKMKLTKAKLKQIIKEEVNQANPIDSIKDIFNREDHWISGPGLIILIDKYIKEAKDGKLNNFITVSFGDAHKAIINHLNKLKKLGKNPPAGLKEVVEMVNNVARSPYPKKDHSEYLKKIKTAWEELNATDTNAPIREKKQMKLTKAKLKQIIQEEIDEHFSERIPGTPPVDLSRPSDSPVQKIEYTEDDVEKLVAALPILQKTAPMSVMLNNLKRDLKTWAAENGREDLMDLINPNPII